jgi:hypothetical protein
MTDSPASPTIAPVTLTRHELAAAIPAVKSGARWFWWIAGLSLVNIVLFQSGSTTNFVVGLGVTALSDAMFAQSKSIGFVIDAIALGFFFLMGLQAQRGKLWVFYLGVTVYALDALIYVAYQDWMPVAFHGLAIYFIIKGVMSLREALKASG